MPKHTPVLVEAIRAQGPRVSVLPWGRRSDDESIFDKVIGRLVDMFRIWRELQVRPYDTLIVKTAHDMGTLSRDIPLLLLTRPAVKNVILQFHGSYPNQLVGRGRRAFKLLSRILLSLAHGALVLSSEEQRQWQRFRPTGRFLVVENPFLPSAYAAPAGRDPLEGLSRGTPVILFAGRLHEAKGVFDLLAAFGELAQRRPCQLVLAGDGPAADALRFESERLGLHDRVSMLGYLTGAALNSVYASSTMLVLPSYSEGFPTVVTEAMHFGLPIVTTAIRGMADRLADGVNALFVAPGDRRALAAAIERLLADEDLRARMGEANRAKVQDFEPEAVARRYLQAVEVVVRRQAALTPDLSAV
jgi:glycosyltransferase involved in cell wall biosynthesis